MLTYPKLKDIINDGGSEETIKIADKFKDNSKFRIISTRYYNFNKILSSIKAFILFLEFQCHQAFDPSFLRFPHIHIFVLFHSKIDLPQHSILQDE